MAFEIGMVRTAAENATEERVAALAQALEANRTSIADPARFQASDMAFHHAIAAVRGNPIYPAVSQAMLEWLGKFYSHLVRHPGAERVILSEHEAIFQCIAAGDADGAATAMTAHLTRANQFYRREQMA